MGFCHCQVFDKNSDGFIDEHELQQTMKELGVTLSSEDVTAMFTEAGCRDQRRITYEGRFSSLTESLNAVPPGERESAPC